MPSKVWTPPSSTVRGPPLSPWEQAGEFSSQSRYSHLTLLVPRPSPPAHSMELLIVSFVRAWQSLLLFRIGTWDCGRIISIGGGKGACFCVCWRLNRLFHLQHPKTNFPDYNTHNCWDDRFDLVPMLHRPIEPHIFGRLMTPTIHGGMIRTRQRCAQCQIQRQRSIQLLTIVSWSVTASCCSTSPHPRQYVFKNVF